MKPEQRKILVASKDQPFTDETILYSIQLASRLDYGLVTLHVGSGRILLDDRSKVFQARASEIGIPIEHHVCMGDLCTEVETFHHAIKRIEFVITGSEEDREELAGCVTIPVFSIMSKPSFNTRRKTMAAQEESRAALWMKTIGYGVLTGALYAAVFTNSETVMTYFTKGGFYAALPIATVFVFSLAHGTFASNLWSLLGINAKKKDSARPTIQDSAQVKARARKKSRAYAYVNPFHRI